MTRRIVFAGGDVEVSGLQVSKDEKLESLG